LSAQRCYSNRDAAPAPLPATTTWVTNFASNLPTAKQKNKKKQNNCIASTFVAVTPLCKSVVNHLQFMQLL